MNNWGIPKQLEEKIKNRDKFCVYCHIKLLEYPNVKGSPKDKATWEHIKNDGMNSEKNVARCCNSCNASKGVKKLDTWFDSPYCKKRNINKETVADIVKNFLRS